MMMHSRVGVGHTGLCAISYSYYNISSHTESRVHHGFHGKCGRNSLKGRGLSQALSLNI